MVDDQIKEAPLPDRVSVRVEELHKLREEAAMLAALKIAKVEEWYGWNYAEFVYENDPGIGDIRQGWLSVLGYRADRGTGDKAHKEWKQQQEEGW